MEYRDYLNKQIQQKQQHQQQQQLNIITNQTLDQKGVILFRTR
jgi:hypothetical protein